MPSNLETVSKPVFERILGAGSVVWSYGRQRKWFPEAGDKKIKGTAAGVYALIIVIGCIPVWFGCKAIKLTVRQMEGLTRTEKRTDTANVGRTR